MKKKGQGFQDNFQKSIPSDVGMYRFKDPPPSFSKLKCNKCGSEVSNNVRFASKNICDYSLYSYPYLFYLELKSIAGTSFPIKETEDRNGKEKLTSFGNQIKQITEQAEHKGIIGGLLMNFRDNEETYFISIHQYHKFKAENARKSIPVSYVREFGIKLDQKQLRVNIRYDIKKMITDIIKKHV